MGCGRDEQDASGERWKKMEIQTEIHSEACRVGSDVSAGQGDTVISQPVIDSKH